MYTNTALKIINDTDPVVGANGVQYPGNWPKTDPNLGLFPVTLTAQPTDPSLQVNGFVIQNISGVYTQVWQTVTAPAPSAAQVDTIIAASANAAMIQKANRLTAAGKTAEALQILLQLQQGGN